MTGRGRAGASEALTPEDLRLLGATLRIEGKDLFAEEVYATRCPAEDEGLEVERFFGAFG